MVSLSRYKCIICIMIISALVAPIANGNGKDLPRPKLQKPNRPLTWVDHYSACDRELPTNSDAVYISSKELIDLNIFQGTYQGRGGLWLVQDGKGRFVELIPTRGNRDYGGPLGVVIPAEPGQKEKFIYIHVVKSMRPDRTPSYAIVVSARKKGGVKYFPQNPPSIIDEDLRDSFIVHLQNKVSQIDRLDQSIPQDDPLMGLGKSLPENVSEESEYIDDRPPKEKAFDNASFNLNNALALKDCRQSLSSAKSVKNTRLMELINEKLNQIEKVPDLPQRRNYDGNFHRRIAI